MVDRVHRRRLAEIQNGLPVSGGVALGRLPFLGTSGVDVVSVGALTHSAPAADLGLDWAPRDPG